MFFILLLCLYVLSATESYQLLKLPFLIEHYFEHQSQQNHLGVMDFFAMHYTLEHEHAKEHQSDTRLPFKQVHVTDLAIVHHWASPSLVRKPSATFLSLPSFASPLFLIPTAPIASVWQPPKKNA
jgi:hypothetical protein